MKVFVAAGRKARITGLLLLSIFGSIPAFAWDGIVSGTVLGFDVTAGNNFGFRVYLNGVTSMCGNSINWAYLNEGDSNYKSYVAAVMMAKAQGSSVFIYTTQVNGYCQIGHLGVR